VKLHDVFKIYYKTVWLEPGYR